MISVLKDHEQILNKYNILICTNNLKSKIKKVGYDLVLSKTNF